MFRPFSFFSLWVKSRVIYLLGSNRSNVMEKIKRERESERGSEKKVGECVGVVKKICRGSAVNKKVRRHSLLDHLWILPLSATWNKRFMRRPFETPRKSGSLVYFSEHCQWGKSTLEGNSWIARSLSWSVVSSGWEHCLDISSGLCFVESAPLPPWLSICYKD